MGDAWVLMRLGGSVAGYMGCVGGHIYIVMERKEQIVGRREGGREGGRGMNGRRKGERKRERT